MFKKEPKISVSKMQLSRDYSFMYENFVILTQSSAYLLLEKSGNNVYALHFDSPHCKYGGPNDEAHGGHPLAKHGLGLYGLFAVDNSPWVQERMVANRTHPRHSDAMFSRYRHYIACFKDVKFESMCQEVREVILSESELEEIFKRELLSIES
ncbi:hypothetical protein [Cupriavidus sp. PET2-C1]